MRSGHVASAQTERPLGAGTQGLRPTRRLQLPILAGEERGRRRLASWHRATARPGSQSRPGSVRCDSVHFLVFGARACAACPLRSEATLSVTPPATSFPESSGSLTGTRARGTHGALALPSSGGELTPQSTSVDSPERSHLGAAALTACGWEEWLLSRPYCLFAS